MDHMKPPWKTIGTCIVITGLGLEFVLGEEWHKHIEQRSYEPQAELTKEPSYSTASMTSFNYFSNDIAARGRVKMSETHQPRHWYIECKVCGQLHRESIQQESTPANTSEIVAVVRTAAKLCCPDSPTQESADYKSTEWLYLSDREKKELLERNRPNREKK